MKRDSKYYYVRHIPKDLTQHYSIQRLCFSLKTNSDSTAIRYSKSITQRLDDYWFGIRLKNMDVPEVDKVRLDNAINDDTPKISEALELYLKLKGLGKDKTFIRTANRNVKYVIKVLGNKSLKSYSSSDGAKFRDWLLANNMNINTVKRVFSSVRSIINITISELGLDCSNGFARTYFPRDDSTESRKPLPIDKIKLIQNLCKEKDDEMRWILALVSDTGMRLGEAVGLLKSDIKYDNKIKQCRKKQKEVYREISSQFNVIRKEEKSALYPWDSTGKSINHYISLFLMSGDEISISCAEFEKNIKIENNYIDGLTVEISTKEVSKWMRNYIN